MHYEQAHAFLVQELMTMGMQFPATKQHVENALYRAKKILTGQVPQDTNPNQTTIRN